MELREKQIKQISDILHDKFDSVYCDTCAKEDTGCDFCHRKNMEWSISRKTALELAKHIADEVLKCE